MDNKLYKMHGTYIKILPKLLKSKTGFFYEPSITNCSTVYLVVCLEHRPLDFQKEQMIANAAVGFSCLVSFLSFIPPTVYSLSRTISTLNVTAVEIVTIKCGSHSCQKMKRWICSVNEDKGNFQK